MTTASGAGRRQILIATGNRGKFREIAAALSEVDAEDRSGEAQWMSLDDLPRRIDAPVEDRSTFAENAALKARYYSRATGLWTLADDSGLEVDALGGAPGVFSARYGGSPSGAPPAEVYRANNARLIAALRGAPETRRTARFRCALALADGDQVLAQTEGVVEGGIIDEPRGSNGFGYDPHFLLPQLGRTMAELPTGEKNQISHRGQALRRMRTILAGMLTPVEGSGDPSGVPYC